MNKLQVLKNDFLTKKYKIYIGSCAFSTDWKQIDITWKDLIKRLSNPVKKEHTFQKFKEMKELDKVKAGKMKDVGGFVPGIFNCKEGNRREKDLTYRTMIALDIESTDKAKVTSEIFEKIEVIKYECFYHTTHGHTKENPRIRIIFPLLKSVTCNEYRHISKCLVRELKLINVTDEASYKPNQLMFWSSKPIDTEFKSSHIKGKLVNPDELLDNYVVKETKKLNSPLHEEGIIGEFCKKYDVVDVIDEFLEDIYEEGNFVSKYTYLKSPSKSPNGAQVYSDNDGNPNQFLFCRNNSDPCNDNHCHNSFDLIKHHLCNGNIKKAIVKAKEILGYDINDTDDEWDLDFVKIDKKGNITPKLSINNFKRALNLNGIDNVKYNEMTSEFEINGEEINFDKEMAKLKDYCNKYNMIGVSSGTMREYTLNLGLNNTYHPVKDYLDSIKPKEGLETFNDMVDKVFTYSNDENADFYKILLKKWLISAVASIYDINFSSDGFIVFQGSQGLGKSSFFREITPIENAFKGEISNFDPKDKDSVRLVTKYWITELAEIKGTFKKDRDNLKGFITSSCDEYRRAFHMSDTRKKRQTVFGGSVNDTQFLKDETGDRRFWVLPILNIDWKYIRDSVNLNDLWGEIKNLYINKISHRLSTEERDFLNKLNLEFKVRTNIESLILTYIDDSETTKVEFYTLQDLFKYFSNSLGNIKELTEINIGKALTTAGYNKIRKRVNGKRKYGYDIPLKKSEIFGRYI